MKEKKKGNGMDRNNEIWARLNMKCFAKSAKALGVKDEDGNDKWLPFSQIKQVSINGEVTDEQRIKPQDVQVGDLVNDLIIPEWLAKIHDLENIGDA